MTRTTTTTTTTRWMWRRESSDERVPYASMPSLRGGGRPTIPSYRSTSSPSALRLSENGHPSEISASSFELASHSRGATPRVCAARHRRHVMAGDDSDSDDILMSEDATNWMSVGKGVNPLAEIARITGRTPRTEDRKRNATNTPANTEDRLTNMFEGPDHVERTNHTTRRLLSLRPTTGNPFIPHLTVAEVFFGRVTVFVLRQVADGCQNLLQVVVQSDTSGRVNRGRHSLRTRPAC